MKCFPHQVSATLILLMLAGHIGAIRAASPATEVNLSTLLGEMIDRNALAKWPNPEYTGKEATSHDRRKTDPSNYDGWHSNNDFGQFIRTETNEGRQEWVIMEDTGPGVITRFWAPLYDKKDQQVIRFYFDGSSTPAITANFNDLMAGTAFVRPPLALVTWDQTDVKNELKPDYKAPRGEGGDLFLPIAFAKSCKITLDSLPFYYGISYRIYDPGTTVRTFSMAEFEAAKPMVERVSQTLLAQPTLPLLNHPKKSILAPGQEMTLDLPLGSAAVQSLQVRIDPKEAPQVLHSTILRATFDDQTTIWCPLGEFFGCGARLHAVRDWDRAVSEDGTLTASWVMPYRHTAHFSLENVGDKSVSIQLAAHTGPWKWDDRSMYFHANWHSEHDAKTRPMYDWNYIDTHGQGVYVGDTFTVFSPVTAWYGEGDERIYLDAEKIPSMIGTGTEDYYGYAWGMSEYFNSAFISSPKRDGINKSQVYWCGYTTSSRIRSLDGIPFRHELKVDMEVSDWIDTKIDHAVGVFWYALPGATSNRELQPEEARIAIRDKPLAPGEVLIPGAIECEALDGTTATPGVWVETQANVVLPGGWSGGQQLFVHGTKPGDYVDLLIPVADGKRHKLTLYATKSLDYGILRFSVNGETAGKDFDAYNPIPIASGPIELGSFTPKDGVINLRVEAVGTNAASVAIRYGMGLDCIVLD